MGEDDSVKFREEFTSPIFLFDRARSIPRGVPASSLYFALHPPLLNDVLLRALWTFFSSFHDCHSDADLGKASTYA